MPVDPKWLEVRAALAADIRSGVYPIGSRIPSPPDLVARFDCDRNTIRRATSHLRDIGVLEAIIGSGTYVRTLPPDPLPAGPKRPTLESRVSALEAKVERLERRQPPTSG